MTTVKAHYDGKVLVLHEPVDLPKDQTIDVHFETPAAAAKKRTDFREWIGLAKTPGQKPYDPSEEDALWEKGMIPRTEPPK